MINDIPIIDSASILVIRDNEKTGALEVLMGRRNKAIEFAGGAYVFPGGKVDSDDLKYTTAVRGFPVGYGELCMTAFREVFEESGLIIGKIGNALEYREALLSGKLSLCDFIDKSGASFNHQDIIPFARWITPRVYKKRFDTRFFLAKAPKSQIATPDKSEIVEIVWVKPLDFIEKFQKQLMFPTLMNLKLLGQAGNVDEAFMQSKQRKIITVEPKLVGGIRVIDPAAGYGEVDQSNIHPGVKKSD